MRTPVLISMVGLALAASLTAGCVNTTNLSSGCDGGWVLCGCKSDTDCDSSAPRCDVANNKCVPCLPVNDNCTGGTKCLPDGLGSHRCAQNCISATDCPQALAASRAAHPPASLSRATRSTAVHVA